MLVPSLRPAPTCAMVTAIVGAHMLNRTTTFLVFLLVTPAWADEWRASSAREPAAPSSPVVLSGVWQGGLVHLPPGAAEILRPSRAPRTIIVGDPSIVDASVIGEGTIAVTAKSIGSTNMILLDTNHAEITRGLVQVGPAARSIQVMQGEKPQEYACKPACTAVEVPLPSTSYTTTYVTRDAQGNPVSSSMSVPNVAVERGATSASPSGAVPAQQR